MRICLLQPYRDEELECTVMQTSREVELDQSKLLGYHKLTNSAFKTITDHKSHAQSLQDFSQVGAAKGGICKGTRR